MAKGFLPVTPQEVKQLGWEQPDFVYVTGDAYVDHPSFGLAIISRVLEKNGYKVAMLPQPDWHTCEDFKRFGKPRLGFLVTAGVIDSMVNHYTAAKKKRSEDAYAPGGRAGYRPDRATAVYSNRIREAYGSIPIIIGGVEASLRRFAHYDYWDDRVRNSMLVDSGADVLMFGMGERSILKVAQYLESRQDFSEMRIPGTCVMSRDLPEGFLEIPSAAEVAKDKYTYAEAFKAQYDQQDPVRGKPIAQKHGKRYLLQNKPDLPLTRGEMDAVYALPYMRAWHPMYDEAGGIPALEEVQFSIASVRGCFGACNFCALTFHQGRIVTSRSKESIIAEGKLLTRLPGFKGYIHDVGGPTANFREPACAKQLKSGACKDRQCLFPEACRNMKADHREYIEILRSLRELPGVKKVFVRSGIRFDYLLKDTKSGFLNELVKYHVSGQLKVAPEHVSPRVLSYMGKPEADVFEDFVRRYKQANENAHMNQYLVPYFMSSHPGSNMDDAIQLACYLKKSGMRPEQVQDFYPTPGTMSTAMFHTGLDPRTMQPVYVPRDYNEKAMQRALMQYYNPVNHKLVRQALLKAGRDDLIGWSGSCLIPPYLRENKKDDKKVPRKDVKRENRPAKKTAPAKKTTVAKGRPAEKKNDCQRPAKHGGKPTRGGCR
ncbi:MAG: YgiQ family radical SAM protein [Clostridia bacterium]|nr:YgiQ family radical SAM protein [Clostridia bacterium]